MKFHHPHSWLATITIAAIAAASSLLAVPAQSAPPPESRVYFGTYDSPTSQGIYMADWNPETGTLGTPVLAGPTSSPSFLALTPDRKFIIAVNENGTPQNPGGAVSSWSINATTGQLTLVNQRPSHGTAPCHVAVSPDGHTVVIANYGGGSFASYQLDPAGTLSEAVTVLQNTGLNTLQGPAIPRGHSATFSPDGNFVFLCDLGLDRVFSRRVTATTSSMDPNPSPDATVPTGSGPRHFAFHPTLPAAYAINETASTMTSFSFDPAHGELKPRPAVSTLPAGTTQPNSTAHVAVHPSGKWVYGSNRGHDSLARFSIHPDTGELTFEETTPSGGQTPRNFNINNEGKWLLAAHQESNSVVVHAIHPTTGTLTRSGSPLTIGKPVCVVFY
jgi:6-phosphogluconolactonase